MKLVALVFVTVIAGCHHDKAAATTTPVEPTDSPTTAQSTQPPPSVTTDQKVSHTLALSGDLVQQCGIKLTESAANPKFDYDTDDLTPDDRTILAQLATCVTTGPLTGKSLKLIGRADPRGTEQYNLALGSRRAGSASAYLEKLGVGAAQLSQTTRGAVDATGTDPAGWANDRRVDIQLTQS